MIAAHAGPILGPLPSYHSPPDELGEDGVTLRTPELVDLLAADSLAIGDDAEDLNGRRGQLRGSLLPPELIPEDAEIAAQLQPIAGRVVDDFVGSFVLPIGCVELADDLVDLVGRDIADMAG